MLHTIRLPASSNEVSDSHDDAKKKSFSRLIHHHLQSIQHCPEFEPRPSAFVQLLKNRQIRRGLLTEQSDIVPSDNDIWIERTYRTVHGKKVRYFCSFLTGTMTLFQPPTGAAFVIHECDLNMYMSHPLIFKFVNELPPVTMELVKAMRRPRPDFDFLHGLGFHCRSSKKLFSGNTINAGKSYSTQATTTTSTISSKASM